MTARVFTVVLAGIALLVAAGPIFAHHSFSAEFDSNQTLKLTGTVTKVEWMNPHTYFYIDVKDEASGKVVNWACEMGSPNSLTAQGWTRNTLKVGMTVSLEGYKARDGRNIANARTVTVDGQRLGAASSSETQNQRQ